jgi:hypothetical protein
MTFREMCKFCTVGPWLAAPVLAAMAAIPLSAQIRFSGQLATNSSTPVTLANPANYTEAVTTVDVSSTGAMSCTTYPQITFLMCASRGLDRYFSADLDHILSRAPSAPATAQKWGGTHAA